MHNLVILQALLSSNPTAIYSICIGYAPTGHTSRYSGFINLHPATYSRRLGPGHGCDRYHRAFHGRFENARRTASTPACTLDSKLPCYTLRQYVFCETHCYVASVTDGSLRTGLPDDRSSPRDRNLRFARTIGCVYCTPPWLQHQADVTVEFKVAFEPTRQLKLVQRAGQVIVCSGKHEAVPLRYLCSELMKGWPTRCSSAARKTS